MKNAARCVVLLMMVGLAAAPTWAAELRTTGFIDNIFPHYQNNISQFDFDVTRNSDQSTWGRTRGRLYFNLIANDDLRGVFGFELDAAWGRNPDGADFSFDRNTDMAGNIETKWLYVDFRVPQVPVGNRTKLGGIPLYVTPIHGATILHGDVGGGDLLLTLTDQVALQLYYAQFEEDSAADVDRVSFFSDQRLGEDYATGMTIRLKPLDGLEVHLPFVYGHLQLPSNTMTSQSGPGAAIPDYFLNVTTESRYYMGFDSRYRIGDLSIEPTFIYLTGSRQFDSASQASTGVSSTSFNAFFGNLNVSYTWGPFLLQGKFAYLSGNKANDDFNNRGTSFGRKSDVKVYTPMNVDGGLFFQEWFEIFGNSEVDGTSIDTFVRMGEAGTLNRYGWQVLASALEYKATDNLILEGAAGGFWAAQKPACPSNLLTTAGTCGGPTQPQTGDPVFNFTGNSRYLGWEVAAGARYTIMPGLTWTPRLAYADYGKGLDQNNRKAQDAWVLVNRVIYIF